MLRTEEENTHEVLYMKKRGVELSMNVIIIAAIALIVLVVLILLVTGAFQRVKDGTGCRGNPGGQCVNAGQGGSDPCVQQGKVRIASDCPQNQVCCIQPVN